MCGTALHLAFLHHGTDSSVEFEGVIRNAISKLEFGPTSVNFQFCVFLFEFSILFCRNSGGIQKDWRFGISIVICLGFLQRLVLHGTLYLDTLLSNNLVSSLQFVLEIHDDFHDIGGVLRWILLAFIVNGNRTRTPAAVVPSRSLASTAIFPHWDRTLASAAISQRNTPFVSTAAVADLDAALVSAATTMRAIAAGWRSRGAIAHLSSISSHSIPDPCHETIWIFLNQKVGRIYSFCHNHEIVLEFAHVLSISFQNLIDKGNPGFLHLDVVEFHSLLFNLVTLEIFELFQNLGHFVGCQSSRAGVGFQFIHFLLELHVFVFDIRFGFHFGF
mmetsp:Transcript_46/g.106  ORF Transcript_46/g.106 Transcript_46/m.106 type:complete len:331 (-) Transcript_46:1481-2473(-)